MKKVNIIRTICSTFVATSLTYSLVFGTMTEAIINVDSVPIIDSIGIDSKIIDIALQNEVITVLNKVDRFYEVEYKGQKGYINEELIDIVKTVGEVLDDNVSLLISPDSNSEVIGSVSKDTNLLIVDKSDDYFEIQVQDKVGYVERDLVFASVLETEEELQRKIEIINSRQVVEGFVVLINSSNVNLRAEPTTSAESIGRVNQGAQLEVVATLSEGWTEVLYNGQTAYVYSDYATLVNKEDLPDLSGIRSEIVEFSKQFLGTPYVYGGTSLTNGVDCSGFMYSLYANFGISLNRSSRDQFNNGVKIDKSELLPGDMVFFTYYGGNGISHAGMYIGDNKFIHAASGSANKVIITDLSEDYYVKNYYGAVRVIND